MVKDGTLKDQVDPKLKDYELLVKYTSKVYTTPFLGSIKQKKPRRNRKLRGTIKQANHAARKMRQKVDA